MQAFEAEIARFAGVDAQVLGISVDSVPSKKAWAETLEIKSFPMLADFWQHGAVAESYGILREEGFSERATFIIDKEGIICYKNIHPIGELPDLEELLEVLKNL